MEWTLIFGLIAVGVGIVVVLAAREFMLWYLKIDVRLKALHEIRDLLDAIASGRPKT